MTGDPFVDAAIIDALVNCVEMFGLLVVVLGVAEIVKNRWPWG